MIRELRAIGWYWRVKVGFDQLSVADPAKTLDTGPPIRLQSSDSIEQAIPTQTRILPQIWTKSAQTGYQSYHLEEWNYIFGENLIIYV